MPVDAAEALEHEEAIAAAGELVVRERLAPEVAHLGPDSGLGVDGVETSIDISERGSGRPGNASAVLAIDDEEAGSESGGIPGNGVPLEEGHRRPVGVQQIAVLIGAIQAAGSKGAQEFDGRAVVEDAGLEDGDLSSSIGPR